MKSSEKQRLGLAIGVFWILLCYIVAALIWWFISLEIQNREMTELKKTSILRESTATPDTAYYDRALKELETERQKNLRKYLSEGITFLALILVGAGFVYRSFRRQITAQQQQQHFLMAVTHELKTPIAITKLNLETLQKHQLEESKKVKIMQMTLEEISRLNTLTNNILYSSQLEGDSYKISREELNFSDLLNGTLQDFIRRYPQRQWTSEIEPDVEMKGDPLLLKLLVSNLLENAHKYSPTECPVELRLSTTGGYAELRVSDRGKGIPGKEKNRIFKKFYRIGDETTRTAKGTGLGLFLSKKIVNDHRGSIFVTDNTPTGSTFVVRLKTIAPHE